MADPKAPITLEDMRRKYREMQGELTELEKDEYKRKRRIKELTEQRDALNRVVDILFPQIEDGKDKEEEEEEERP